MNGRRRLAAATAGLAATALAGCAGTGPDATTGEPAAAAQDPGYSATGAEIVETGADGRPRYRLQAEAIRQDPATLTVLLERPRMQVDDAAAGPWRVAADSGSIPQGAQRVDLAGDVRVTGTVGAPGEPIEIRAPELRYELDAARVSAPREVSILMSGQWLSARGLEADLKDRRLRLESDVHGRFTP
jgi:LPS export ABC transporter protein LptC